jgi:hypothetical protein
MVLGFGLVGTRQFDEAFECAEEGLSILHAAGTPIFLEPHLADVKSSALVGKGEAGAAVEEAQRGLQTVFDLGVQANEAPLRVALAEALLARDGAAAREAIEAELEAVGRLEKDGHVAIPTVCRAIELRAALAEALGDRQAREVLLKTARARYRSMGAAGRVARITQQLEANS